MGMKRVWLEWTTVNVSAGGRWEIALDQVLDIEDHLSAYVAVLLQGSVAGAGGVMAKAYTYPAQLNDSVGSARGTWPISGESAIVAAGFVNQTVWIACNGNQTGTGAPGSPTAPQGVLSVALESVGGTGTFSGQIRVLVCLKGAG